MTLPNKKPLQDPPKRVAPEVKGPIMCHTCQQKCVDAAEYLSHSCKPGTPSLNDWQTRRFFEGIAMTKWQKSS